MIDFIDMKSQEHIRSLERHLRTVMRIDRAKYSLGRVSQFGTIEITRQRLRPSVQRRSSGNCPHCDGTGRIQSSDTISLQALRRIKAELPKTSGQSIKVILNPKVAEDFQNNMRLEIVNLENMYNKRIIIVSDSFVEVGGIKIEQTS